jgi:hypothetical protein
MNKDKQFKRRNKQSSTDLFNSVGFYYAQDIIYGDGSDIDSFLKQRTDFKECL